VSRWLAGVTAHRYAKFALAGGVSGLVILAIALIIRGQRHDTLIIDTGPAPDPNEVRVYVGGAVAIPGVYSLPRGSVISDAIDAAGGLTEGADTNQLGMAAILLDADQIIIPTTSPATVEPPKEGSTPAPVSLTAPAAGPININSAGAAELEALPGIGPALAQRIVDYRTQNGPFQSIDELEAVRGISAEMVTGLKPLITVGP